MSVQEFSDIPKLFHSNLFLFFLYFVKYGQQGRFFVMVFAYDSLDLLFFYDLDVLIQSLSKECI